jgi:DNA topoisomerase VI subunit B
MADKVAAGKAKAKGGSKTEVLQFKSPAEFFAENQNIAGFDNVSMRGGEPLH